MTRKQAFAIARAYMASWSGDWAIDETAVRFGAPPGNYAISNEPCWIVPLRPTGLYLGATNVLVVRPDPGQVERVRFGE